MTAATIAAKLKRARYLLSIACFVKDAETHDKLQEEAVLLLKQGRT